MAAAEGRRSAGHGRAVRRAKLLQALRGGSTRRAAYDYAGVPEGTFYDWLANDHVFSEEVTQAEASVDVLCSASVVKAAQKDYRAAVEFLKRRRSAEWKEVSGTEHSGQIAVEEIKRVGADLDRLGPVGETPAE